MSRLELTGSSGGSRTVTRWSCSRRTSRLRNTPSRRTAAAPNLSILGSLNVDLGVIFSDIRLKRDIARVGTLDNGLPLYRYKYLWSDQVFVGVMAQEVADVAPDAVVKGDDGYLRVNYAQLGTSMKPWEQWSAERGWLSREAN